MSATAIAKKKAPVMFVELYDMRDSGFIRDGTEGTKHEAKLTSSSKFIVPNQSWKAIENKETGELEHHEIQWIKGHKEILVQKHRELGIKGNLKTDKLIIEDGHMSIAREGKDIGLYDYLENCFYNASNPNRSEGASKLFKVVDLTKVEEEINERDLLVNEAVAMVYTLQTKKGGAWVYQEDKINSWCELFNVSAERFASKITALAGMAKMFPKDFLDKVAKFEQESATLVAHALQLNVIKFEGNTAVYISKDKIVKDFGVGKLKHDEKIAELATFLRSKDGHEAEAELKAEVEFAKEKQLA